MQPRPAGGKSCAAFNREMDEDVCATACPASACPYRLSPGMAPRHPFLLRLSLAAVAMLLLSLACYIGLGWAVWTDQIWLSALVGGDRFSRLHTTYGNVMATLLPGDRDRDGVCDGAE